MMHWLQILSSTTMLFTLAGGLVFTLAFWKLNLLAPTPAVRTGFVVALVNLGFGLIYGMLWILPMLPGGFGNLANQIYQTPFLWQVLWGAVTLCFGILVVCLAWTLHRGIHPTRNAP